MSPRERVLASLKREPVDRISYCEHLADPGVVIKAAGGIDKLTSNQEILRDASSIPLDRTIKDLEKRKVKPFYPGLFCFLKSHQHSNLILEK
ncbi:unnamed protein product [marine sediment metagenome]|uniref:Uncharacterized protein n=1 Tax=marine sediment metagenome TaxID=412755 RepID=X1VQG7_9ZZZZ